MNKRTRTFWIPSSISLTASMVSRLTFQAGVEPQQKLLNHAGLPLLPQLLWLAVLMLLGATTAYVSRRAGGGRMAAVTAALFPAFVMIPMWAVFAMKMALPSPAQWLGLFSGVLNWIVLPGAALLLGLF